MQEIIKRVFFVLFPISLFFFLDYLIEKRLIISSIHETSHPSYRASAHPIRILDFDIHVGFPAPRALLHTFIQAYIVWKALKLRRPFYSLLVAFDHFYLSKKLDPFVMVNACSKYLPVPYKVGYADILAFIVRFFLLTWLILQ